MANHLMRFDPFRTISRLEPLSKFGDVLNNLSLAPLSPLAWTDEMESMIKLDVTETDKAYTVRAEIPGVKKEDIKVDINGNQIMISTEVKRETQEKSSSTIRCECYYGEQVRSFTLGHDVDVAKADATYENGILMLKLPKKADGANHKKLVVH